MFEGFLALSFVAAFIGWPALLFLFFVIGAVYSAVAWMLVQIGRALAWVFNI